MNLQELTRHIEKTTGKLFISKGEIASLGFGKDTVREIVKSIDCITTGTEGRYRLYYIRDVARAIMDRRLLN